jgi:hypothetical protein
VTAASVAWADAASKAAKIAELLQLSSARQMLHEVDGKFDQEDAVRAWGRFYSENVTENDLDAILAYYRSPAGQADVSASRAALGRIQHYMVEKRTAVPANGVASAPGARGTATAVTASPGANQARLNAAPSPPGTTVTQSSATPPPLDTDTAPARPWDSPPRAPDGRIVSGPSSPERCEIAPSVAPTAHAVSPSGRSVVCVCTDEKGTLTRDPVIAESSGDSRVDSGAIKMARVGSGRYAPPTLDGHPQSACFRFAIDFRHPQ